MVAVAGVITVAGCDSGSSWFNLNYLEQLHYY